MNSHQAIRRCIAGRIREIRIDRFGEKDLDLANLANSLNLLPATWRNYEDGIVIPGEILLQFIELTRVSPHWLLTGEGDRYTGRDFRSRFSREN